MKLLSTTILATAAIAVAGAASAGPAHIYVPGGDVLNGQLNLGDTKAKLTVISTIPPLSSYGRKVETKVEATAAAIGNSLSVEIDDPEMMGDVKNVQFNAGDARARMIMAPDAAEEIDDMTATVAAIGNSASIDLKGDLGSKVENSQVNAGFLVKAVGFVAAGDNEDLEATIAAIGNSASVEVDEEAISGVSSFQYNAADAIAKGEVIQEGDTFADKTKPGKVDVTVAAIGNSLSVTAEDGYGYSWGGDVRAVQINDGFDVDSSLFLLAEDGVKVDATVAAIGNSASFDLSDRLSQDLSVKQTNWANASADGDMTGFDLKNKKVDATVAAIGNSASITVEGDWKRHNSFGKVNIAQSNLSETVKADMVLGVIGGVDKVNATTAAIGNSASVELSKDFFTGVKSHQMNTADATAKMEVALDDATDVKVDLTAAAIGNSLSISVGAK